MQAAAGVSNGIKNGAKAEAELKRLGAIKRKKVNAQKLASQVGRTLQRLKVHKYFSYSVDTQGQLQWEPKGELIAQEAQQDGWYLLHTNETVQKCSNDQVLGHYKGLLDVEELSASSRAIWKSGRFITGGQTG